METWKYSEITSLSEAILWDVLLFLGCLWNVKFLHGLIWCFILPSLNWNPSMLQQSKKLIWHVTHILVFQKIFLLEVVGFHKQPFITYQSTSLTLPHIYLRKFYCLYLKVNGPITLISYCSTLCAFFQNDLECSGFKYGDITGMLTNKTQHWSQRFLVPYVTLEFKKVN